MLLSKLYVCVYVCRSFDFAFQDHWPVPPGTLAKEKLNVRLARAHEEFMVWTRAKKIPHLACQ